MKRKIGGFLFACVIVGATVGVINDSATEVEAGTPKGFKVVGKTDAGDWGEVYELVHKKTGCHYLLSEGYHDDNVIIQMYTAGGNGGVGKPYCEEKK